MRIIGEGVSQSEPAHDGEGDMIHDASLIRLAAGIGGPSLIPIVIGRNDEQSGRLESFP